MSTEMPGDAFVTRFLAAQVIAREAGHRALALFARRHELVVERKTEGVYDTATAADRAVEAFVRERLSALFPEDGFLGEESAAGGLTAGGPRVWVVDPIDGTDCFVSGIPVWCVSIALVCAGRVELGVIFDPNRGELFAARAGGGATLDGGAIRPCSAGSLDDGVMGIGLNHRIDPGSTLEVIRRLLAAGGMCQRNGSGALMLAYVACGRLIGYYEAHINAWDALAGVALVREAGGWTNDFLTDRCLEQGNEIVAAAPGVAASVQALVGGG